MDIISNGIEGEYKDLEYTDKSFIRVSRRIYEGKEYIDIRQWARVPGSDKIYPRRRGIMMKKDFVMDQLLPALTIITCTYNSMKNVQPDSTVEDKPK